MCRSRAFAMLVKSWIQWILEIVFSRMGRCLWNHGFAKFGVFLKLSFCMFFLTSCICVFFVKSLCLHFCEVTKLRINEYHEYATLLFFWSHKIYIVVNLRNCDLYERCECSYLLFAKINNFNFVIYRNCCFHDGCGLAHLLFLWIHGFYCLWIFDITIYLKS